MNTSDPERVLHFAQSFCRHTQGALAGGLVQLRDWQRDIVTDLVESGARRGYLQMARKNGKSMVSAILALYCTAFDGEEGAEVYSVAGSRDQARVVFRTAARMVALDPHLRKHLVVHEGRGDILHRPSGSRYRVLASDAGHAEGLSPSLVVFDEVHVEGSDRRLWDALNLGSGTRDRPLVLGVTTPGVRWGVDGRDSLAWSLWDYSKRVASGEVADPAWWSRIYEAPPDCDLEDREAWAAANPGLGDFLDVEDMATALKVTPENEFRTKRLAQWVSAQAAWMPYGSWEACAVPQEVPDGTRIVVGFDGSKSLDSTALVAATIEPEPYLFVLGCWEREPTSRHDWTVPHAEVEAAVLEAHRRFTVVELVADKTMWARDLQAWEETGVPVLDYPQIPARMVPAAQLLYEATTTGVLRHDGDPAMARHVGNAVLRPNGQLAKEFRQSGRKIDLAVAAVMAYSRARLLASAPERAPLVVTWW